MADRYLPEPCAAHRFSSSMTEMMNCPDCKFAVIEDTTDQIIERVIELMKLNDLDMVRDAYSDPSIRDFNEVRELLRTAIEQPASGDPEPCDYCNTKGRSWTPECEENKHGQ